MSRRHFKYTRGALLLLKPRTDVLPMIFKARYVHREGRWCTFAQLEALSSEGMEAIDCGHVNISRSVVSVHQALEKSDHHRMVYFVARVRTYWFNGDRRGKLMLERMDGVPSLWFEDGKIFGIAAAYIQDVKRSLK